MAILIINPMESHCGHCGESALYEETSHITQIGYNPGQGCGAVFDSVGSDYVGIDGEVGYLRPDLEFVPFDQVPARLNASQDADVDMPVPFIVEGGE